jgi:RNA polymerase sigma-70 factor (ECF subfamily)
MNDDLIDNVIQQQQTKGVQTPADKIVNTELKDALEKAIRMLPEKYKVVFVMRELEGMSIAETKECLDISAENVKVRLNRAKAHLERVIKQCIQERRASSLSSFAMRPHGEKRHEDN